MNFKDCSPATGRTVFVRWIECPVGLFHSDPQNSLLDLIFTVPWSKPTAGAWQLNLFFLFWDRKGVVGWVVPLSLPHNIPGNSLVKFGLYLALMRVALASGACFACYAENWKCPGVCLPPAKHLTVFDGNQSVKVQFPCFGLGWLLGVTCTAFVSFACCYHTARFINLCKISLLSTTRHFHMYSFYYSFSILYSLLVFGIQVQSFFIPIRLDCNHISAIVLACMWFHSSFFNTVFFPLGIHAYMHKRPHWIHIHYVWILVPLEPLGSKLMGIGKAWPFI